MDINRLSIEYIESFESRVKVDGYTQTDKILPYLSIVYPRTGFYEVRLEDDPLSMLPAGGGCFIVAPQVRHTIVHRVTPGEEDMAPRWLFMTVLYNNFLDVTSWFCPQLIVPEGKARPFIDSIDELLACTASPADTFRKMRIAGGLLENLLSVSEFTPAEMHMERIHPAIDLVRKHYADRITVDQLAKECDMSPSVFHRAFRSATRLTPMQYLNDYRLKQVVQLLMTDEHTLSAIATRCGFCDEFHLSRNFKNSYGVSPREYKKRTTL